MSEHAELQELMQRAELSQAHIARVAGVNSGTVSKVLSGLVASRRIADVIRDEAAKVTDETDILAGPWEEIGTYEVNLFGVVRKQKDSKGPYQDGQLLRPHKKSARAKIIYTITLNGHRNSISAQDLVRKAHGRERIQVADLYHKILQIISSRKHAPAPKKEYTSRRAQTKTGSRRCHDCGRKTNDYRCELCWRKLRGDTSSYTEFDFGCRISR